MIAEDAKKSQLLAALMDLEPVKAAAILRSDGSLGRGRGRAHSLRFTTEPDDEPASGDPEAGEDVFLKSLGEEYLVVVFAARTDFDDVEAEVVRLLGELEMVGDET